MQHLYPEPPENTRKLRLSKLQAVGVAFLALIPILALVGVFGVLTNSAAASNESLEIDVDYTSRYRYKMVGELTATVRNSSEETLSGVTLLFDRSYIAAFSDVSFTPSSESVTESDYVVPLDEMMPGETRRVSVSLQAEEYGLHRGDVEATADDIPGIEVAVETFVFP